MEQNGKGERGRDGGNVRSDRGEGAVTGEDVSEKTQADKEEGGGSGEREVVSGVVREREKCEISERLCLCVRETDEEGWLRVVEG